MRSDDASGRGIIPAYAGNTVVERAIGVPAGDHPRVCGEHVTGGASGAYAPGSSPRMRGTPVTASRHDTLPGIIPAYAGNTKSPFLSPLWAGDHPRVCGEHTKVTSGSQHSLGSSPRMRGTRHLPQPAIEQQGIIPAYAGNTLAGLRHERVHRDHPRVCGEHQIPVHERVQREGSSPRMRGTL